MALLQAFVHGLGCVSTMEAVTRGPMGLDSRLRVNDMGVELLQKYQGCIFVTMKGKNRPAVTFHIQLNQRLRSVMVD